MKLVPPLAILRNPGFKKYPFMLSISQWLTSNYQRPIGSLNVFIIPLFLNYHESCFSFLPSHTISNSKICRRFESKQKERQIYHSQPAKKDTEDKEQKNRWSPKRWDANIASPPPCSYIHSYFPFNSYSKSWMIFFLKYDIIRTVFLEY